FVVPGECPVKLACRAHPWQRSTHTHREHSMHAVIVRATLLAGLALALITSGGRADEAVIHSARGGAWSSPATWDGGKVPGKDSRVLIRPGHRVVYDAKSDQTIRGI